MASDPQTQACFQQLEAGLKQDLGASMARLQAAAGGAALAEGVPPGAGSGGKVRPPFDEKGITSEWLTAALHERGHLPKAVKVARIEPLVNIGEGRGYANYSWKITATYDKPVAPDIPTQFVLKQINQSFDANWPPGPMRQLADKSYCLECSWYEQLRDRLPIPQPRLFWSGAESPADPSKDLGVYGVLIEWLGDDLKKVDLKDGVTEEETVQAMTTLARLHAAWWNTEEEDALSALFKPEESLQMILGFMGGAELASEYAATTFKEAFGDKFASYVAAGVRTMPSWAFKGCTGDRNRTLCTWDLRTENMVWRRTPGGPDDYECVILDHQVWCYGGAPMFDVAVFFGCSCAEETMAERVEVGLRAYHSTLTSLGVTTYSEAEMHADFNRACWHACSFPCFGGKMVKETQAKADAASPGSAEQQEALQMVQNMVALFNDMARRTKKLVDLRDAYSGAPFHVPGYT